MNKYFEVINLPVPCSFILQNNKVFDLRLGIPSNAVEVYKSGFKKIGLKPGAEVLFKKCSVNELAKLINQAQRVQDVEILLLVKESGKLTAIAEERIKQLRSQ